MNKLFLVIILILSFNSAIASSDTRRCSPLKNILTTIKNTFKPNKSKVTPPKEEVAVVVKSKTKPKEKVDWKQKRAEWKQQKSAQRRVLAKSRPINKKQNQGIHPKKQKNLRKARVVPEKYEQYSLNDIERTHIAPLEVQGDKIHRWQYESQKEGGKIVLDLDKSTSTQSYSNIDDSNLDKIFTYNYSEDRSKFGAKALSYIDEKGNNNIIFWSQGRGKLGNQIHHRDALNSLHGRQRDMYFNKDNDALFSKYDELIDNDAYGSRDQSSFTKEMLQKTQGYQFTMTNVNGKNVITEFSVDSSITAAQVSRKVFSQEKLVFDIISILKRVDPELTSFNSIPVKGVDTFKIHFDINSRKLNELFQKKLLEAYENKIPKQYQNLKLIATSGLKSKS